MKKRNIDFWPNLILIWVVLCVLLADRLTIDVSSGGRGIVPILILLTPLLAALVGFLSRGMALGFLKHLMFRMFWGPFLLLTFLLPLLGVLFTTYPTRTLFASMQAIVVLSFVSLGYWLGRTASNPEILWNRYLPIAIIVQFIYALGQHLSRTGSISSSFWNPFYEWDLSSQLAYGSEVVLGRSTGFYVSANTLGFWGVIAVCASLYLITSRLRYVSLVAALLTILISQSRGALVAVSVVLIAALIWQFVFVRRFRMQDLILSAFTIVIVTGAGWLLIQQGFAEQSVVDRFAGGLSVVTQGSTADQNLVGRFKFWSEALRLHSEYLLGTFGPPEYKLGTAIDNDWVRLLVQGGIIYVLTFILMLGAGISLLWREGEGRFIGALSGAIALAGLTQTPLGYTPILLYWFILGVVFSYGSYGRQCRELRTFRSRKGSLLFVRLPRVRVVR
ncbi:hypothetical protein E0L93_05100 [Rubrobacter taiwanensis]|uniref:O-antigen ligase domain-containing protein n=1 Tax=Rubrobacter taiwanensis TaxID=185139 RepID=A0A4R1BMX0_9ACTN|nr:hypothetical protein [Rubrobacter taiwanensis]TCJ18880.1 hypothetical protein E0L93_05100 [Rubrobacter taiwanensis]